jgi:hypothetical protein
MSHFTEAMFFGHNPGPLFNSSALNFNSLSTAFAYEMMMVGITAEAIDSFTIITPQYINNFVIYQGLQRAVNSCESDALALTLHQPIDLLRTCKSACAFESAQYSWIRTGHL